MRNTDDQLKDILLRAEKIKQNKKIRLQFISSTVVSAVCLVLIPVVLFLLSGMTGNNQQEGMIHYGSLLLTSSHVGYVMTGILAFVSGVLMMIAIQKWQELIKGRVLKNDGFNS